MQKTTLQTILPTAGICNLQPDITCADNQLTDCINLTYNDDAIRPIQCPHTIADDISSQLLLVHETETTKRYILCDDSNALTYITDTDHTPKPIHTFTSKVSAIESIGNTLIVSTADSINYFLWKPSDNSYKFLGNGIPHPDVSFSLSHDGYNFDGEKFKDLTILPDYEQNGVFGTADWSTFQQTKMLYFDGTEWVGTRIDYSNQLSAIIAYNNEQKNKDACDEAIAGLYAKGKQDAHENKAFVNPFFAVYAVRLYNGDYTYISNPILLLPNTSGPLTIYRPDSEPRLKACVTSHFLNCEQRTDYSEWSDIVSDVCIFVSPEVDVLDTSKTVTYTIRREGQPTDQYDSKWVYPGRWLPVHNNRDLFFDVALRGGINLIDGHMKFDFSTNANFHGNNIYWSFFPYKRLENSELMDNLARTSTFFKICELGIRPFSGSTKDKIKKNVLKNLEVQESFKTIDYYSFTTLIPSKMATFNRRLNLVDVKRSFFKGFHQFMPYECNNNSAVTSLTYTIQVTIDTPSGRRLVSDTFTSTQLFSERMPFYYPDPRAKHVTIYSNDYIVLDKDLKEHKGLNGAYYIPEELPTGTERVPQAVHGSPDTPSDSPEPLSNYLLQSEVDNPFSFNAAGYVRVGQGTIIGIAGLTTALSQDAYKVATTIVFTTQGIWALSINSEGQYSSVAPPFSREVCSNPESITMIDQGVFFVSKKGLMLITDNGIRCVSEQLNGKVSSVHAPQKVSGDQVAGDCGDFQDFLHDCRLAYDYRNSHLWLINNRYNHHWCYNIKSGTFSRINDGNQYIGITNFYPDTILQSTDFSLFSLLNRKDINHDPNKYQCSFTTRPIKFGAALRMKTITQMVHLKDLPDNSLSVTIEATNNLKDWTTLHSLHGRGYKYYRLSYDFKDIAAYHTFSGTVLAITETETNKLR